jgi:hypothetical protein
MTALENRQEAILAQLADLKNQIAVLRAHLKQPPVCTVREEIISTNKTFNILQVCFCLYKANRYFIYNCMCVIEALCYELGGCGFDSWCHWIFSIYLILSTTPWLSL